MGCGESKNAVATENTICKCKDKNPESNTVVSNSTVDVNTTTKESSTVVVNDSSNKIIVEENDNVESIKNDGGEEKEGKILENFEIENGNEKVEEIKNGAITKVEASEEKQNENNKEDSETVKQNVVEDVKENEVAAVDEPDVIAEKEAQVIAPVDEAKASAAVEEEKENVGASSPNEEKAV